MIFVNYLKVGLIYSSNFNESQKFKTAVELYGLKKNSEGVYTEGGVTIKLDYLLYVIDSSLDILTELPSGVTIPNALFRFRPSDDMLDFLHSIDPFSNIKRLKLINKISKYDGVYYEFLHDEKSNALIMSMKYQKGVDSPFKDASGFRVAVCDYVSIDGTRMYTYGLGGHAKKVVEEAVEFNGGVLNPLYSYMKKEKLKYISPYSDLIQYLTNNPGFLCLENLLLDGDLNILSDKICIEFEEENKLVNLDVSLKSKENKYLGVSSTDLLIEFYIVLEDKHTFSLEDFEINQDGYITSNIKIHTSGVDKPVNEYISSDEVVGSEVNRDVISMINVLLRGTLDVREVRVLKKRA